MKRTRTSLVILAAVVACVSTSAGQASSKFIGPCRPAIQKCGVPIRINSPGTLNAVVGKAYSFRYHATGGMRNGYVYSVKGALPPGISLKKNGLLHGTATGAGTWRFRVCAKDVMYYLRNSQTRTSYVYSTCGFSTGFTVAPPPNPYPFDGTYTATETDTGTATCSGSPPVTATTTTSGQATVWHGVVTAPGGTGTIVVSGSTGTATVSVSTPPVTVDWTLIFALGPGGAVSLTGQGAGGGAQGSCVFSAHGTITGSRVSP